MKTTKRFILEEAQRLSAIDITTLDFEKINGLRAQENGLETVYISYGVYGMNSGLFRGNKSGKYYVIKARNTALMQLA